jgi:hypothetical protein
MNLTAVKSVKLRKESLRWRGRRKHYHTKSMKLEKDKNISTTEMQQAGKLFHMYLKYQLYFNGGAKYLLIAIDKLFGIWKLSLLYVICFILRPIRYAPL